MKKIITTQCKMNGHLTELPCTAIGCRSYRDCLAEYEKTQKPMTNADRIRAMSDEELADVISKFSDLECSIPFCKNLSECDDLLETPGGVPPENCRRCLLKWLKQPAEVK